MPSNFQTIYGANPKYTFGAHEPNPQYFDPNNGPATGRWSPGTGFQAEGTYDANARASGGFDGTSSIGGVSAVNPQAGQANELDAFKRYEDSAYNSALARLTPQMQRQDADFNQGMVSRGLPVGSDAYNSAMAQKDQSQAGAMQDAAFGAMQFGLGAQNQSFQQDATRSGLANALLQSKWQSDLGWANNGLQRDALNQAGQQFNSKLGFDYDTFYDTLGQRNHEFDSQQDYNYWDRGNFWDFSYDRANSADYFGAYDRDNASRQYDNALFMSLFGGGAPGVQGQNAMGGYGAQMNAANQSQGNMMGFWGNLFGDGADAKWGP